MNYRDCNLGNIGTFVRGLSFQKKELVSSGIGCIHYGEVYTHYGIKATQTRSFLRSKEYHRGFIEPGNLFLATTSENIEDLGKAVAWLGSSPIIGSNDGFIYKHSQDPRYLSHFFTSSMFHRQKVPLTSGTKVKRISAASLGKIKIPLPPIEEQRRIADILDSFDALVNDLSSGLPAEIAARRKQYEYYRDKLLSFPEEGHATKPNS